MCYERKRVHQNTINVNDDRFLYEGDYIGVELPGYIENICLRTFLLGERLIGLFESLQQAEADEVGQQKYTIYLLSLNFCETLGK